MSERAVRVFVADDSPRHRDDICRAISRRQGMELAGSADNGLAAQGAIRELDPDVAVLAAGMPGLGGVALASGIARDDLPVAVLLLSAAPDDVYEAVAAGVAGYLMRGARSDTICAAIEAVARGGTVLAEEAQAALVGCIRERATRTRAAFSEREQQVLALTAEGMSAPQIGAALHLSPTTVKSHLQRAYEKLGVSDRAAAVAVAIRSGLLR